jgi:hypothetical protein
VVGIVNVTVFQPGRSVWPDSTSACQPESNSVTGAIVLAHLRGEDRDLLGDRREEVVAPVPPLRSGGVGWPVEDPPALGARILAARAVDAGDPQGRPGGVDEAVTGDRQARQRRRGCHGSGERRGRCKRQQKLPTRIHWNPQRSDDGTTTCWPLRPVGCRPPRPLEVEQDQGGCGGRRQSGGHMSRGRRDRASPPAQFFTMTTVDGVGGRSGGGRRRGICFRVNARS